MSAAGDLLAGLRARGLEVAAEGGDLRVRGRRGTLTAEDMAALAAWKPEVLALLGAGAGPGPRRRGPDQDGVASDSQYPRNPPRRHFANSASRSAIAAPDWDGEQLEGPVLGIHIELAAPPGRGSSGPALASASNGSDHRLIRPARVGAFLLRHADRALVVHDVAPAYWAVAGHLERRGERQAIRAWGRYVDEGRMHDTMILDQLARLAESGDSPRRRDLGEVARDCGGVEPGEPGLSPGAAGAAVATLAAFRALEPRAVRLMGAEPGVREDALEEFGPLTEGIQIKGAVALQRITADGMRVDLAQLGTLVEGLRRRQFELVAGLEADPAWRGVVRRDRRGRAILSPKTRSPSLDQGRLEGLLGLAVAEVVRRGGPRAPASRNRNGNVSRRTQDWEEIAPFHAGVRAWIELVRASQLLQFFGGLGGTTIHPRYNALVRTGRTSCSAPNVQGLPREGGFREAFVPSPGHLFLIVDYRFIELTTLAAVCLARFGSSRLAEVIRGGIDPHAYTAAMFEGIELADFTALEASDAGEDRARYARLRQRAKVLNFGIPGGLGPAALVAYARSTYGITLTPDEAGGFRRRLIQDVYPELGRYLADDGMEVLARNLGAPASACWDRLDGDGTRSGAVVGGIRNVVRGRRHRADGGPYSPAYLARVWDGLVALNRDERLVAPLGRREGGGELERQLFRAAVATPTGRVRGGVGYTQARNTPFQGLAADGAKLALWDLVGAGHRVVGFIHDEFIVELPEGADHAAEARRVEAIVNRAMERVTGGVPVACEYALARRWTKSAKAVRGDDGRLVPWEDRPP